MNTHRTTHALAALACAVVLVFAAADATADTVAAAPEASAIAPLPPDQLNALVAPIALYPDALVAQCLNAATFPDQVSIAQDWLSAHGDLTGGALASAVDAQAWDPSVKALTQFPNVLSNMAQNLAWTSSLGQAYHYQPADVMDAVQLMRAKAQAAGNLKSTPQIRVIEQAPQTIVIQPADPQVVYVPQYNPTVVYGAPYVVPYYRPVFVAAVPTITFGGGVFIGAGISSGVSIVGGGGGFHWGFNAWNVNWGGGGTVIYNHTTYIHNNIWYGNHYTYNGYRPWGPGPHGPWPYGPHAFGPPAPGSAGMRHYDDDLAHRYTADGGDTWKHDGYGPRGSGPFAPGSPAMQHYDNAMARRYPADGGDTWKHGGYGPMGAAREGFGPTADRYQHQAENTADGGRRDRGNADHFNSFAGNRAHSGWSGNGASSRAESFRGHASMARMRAPAMHEGGGRRR